MRNYYPNLWDERVIKRFWKYVEKTNGCWLWKAQKNKMGYGRFYPFKPHAVLAHRFMFQIINKSNIKNSYILHKCDNPPCVNPDHLYAGTQKDNMHDCIKRGRFKWNRQPKPGEKCHFAKLTLPQVVEIRTLRKQGKGAMQLAKQFNVCDDTIYNILNRRTWK